MSTLEDLRERLAGEESELVVMILSHGRAETLAKNTVRSMIQAGYTGPWYIVLDTADDSADKYEALFGRERIRYFDKVDSAQDMGDNGGHPGVVVHARNACAEIARGMGFKYYMQMDDDYSQWMHRFPEPSEKGGTKLGFKTTTDLDSVIAALVEYLETSGAHTIAMAQGGDLIGGVNSVNWRRGLLRKAMNTFIARTAEPIHFIGRINEDVNTYVRDSMLGLLFWTYIDFQIVQAKTQENAGGLTEAYLDKGTYAKSFYTVMMAPAAVQISTMGVHGHRIHHHIRWGNVAPKIVSDTYRKARADAS